MVFADPWSTQDFRDCLSSDALFLVAEKKDRVVGYVVALDAADEGEILNVAVAPDARRAGIGHTLVHEVISALASMSNLLDLLCQRGRLRVGRTGLYQIVLRTSARGRLLAFLLAAQALAVIREANLDLNKINVNGGAIALGHPLGCTGAKLAATLLNEMRRRQVQFGMVTMCIGGGMGAAGIFELI